MEDRLVSQFLMRIIVWIAINIALFLEVGFGELISLSGILWFVTGTIVVLTVWALIASFFERLWLMKGWSLNIWRPIEYIAMYLIAKNIFNSVL